MTTLTITLDIDDEQLDAITTYTAEWNGPNGTSTKEERIRDDAIRPFIAAKVEAAYSAAVRDLGESARSLTYEQRKAIIAAVKSQMSA